MPSDSLQTRYHIQTLGGQQVVECDTICTLSDYEFALAAYVALAKRPPNRPELCELLWSANGPAEKHRLRQLLYNLSKKVPGLLRRGLTEVDHTLVEVDAATSHAAARRGDSELAVSLFRGQFLAQLPDISPAFSEWRDSRSAELLEAVEASVHARLRLANRDAGEEVLVLTNWLEDYAELLESERVQRTHALLDAGKSTAAAAEMQSLEATSGSRDLEFDLEQLRERFQLIECSRARQVPLMLADDLQQVISSRIRPGPTLPMLLLVGERGIGKTRLLDWIVRLAAVRGAAVYSHRVVSSGVHQPHDQIIRRFLRAFRADIAVDAPRTPMLERLLSGEALPSSHAVAAAITEACSGRWTVIAVDNVNQADNATKKLLPIVSAMDRSQSIQIVCAVSGELSEADSTWIDAMLPSINVIRIEPLPQDLAEILADRSAAIGGFHLSDIQRALIVEHSRGNPSKILQMTSAVGSSLSTPWPSAYADAFVSARTADTLRRLTDQQQQLVRWLAFAGEPLTQGALQVLASEDGADFFASLNQLQALGLISVAAGQVTVASLMVEQTSRALSDHAERRDGLLKLAAFYAAAERHAKAAASYALVGDKHSAGRHYELAGIDSIDKGAFSHAERELKHALAFAEDHTEFQQRSRLLAKYYTRVSRWTDACPHLLALSERSPVEDLVLLVGRTSGLDGMSTDEWLQFVSSLDKLLHRDVDDVTAARAYMIAFDNAYQSGMEGVVLPSFRAYLQRCPAADPRARAELAMKSARVNQFFGDAEMAPREAELAVEHALGTNDPVVLSNAFDTRALIGFLHGNAEVAFRDFERSEEVANSASLYFLRERYYNNLAVLCYETGDIDRARHLLRAAVLFDQHAQLYAVANLAVVELAAGNLELAQSYAGRLIGSWSAACRVIGASIRGMVALESGDDVTARQTYAMLQENISRFGLQVTDPSYTLSFLARIGPGVGFDVLPLLKQAAVKVQPRNVYSYLRIQLTIARSLAALEPAAARSIVQHVLDSSMRVSAINTQAQAEAVLARLSA